MAVAVSNDVATWSHRLASAEEHPAARVACAPMIGDVMGGVCEWSGGLTLTTTLRANAFVAARPESTRQLRIRQIWGGPEPGQRECSCPVAAFLGDGQPLDRAACLAHLEKQQADWALPAVAAAHVLLPAPAFASLATGMALEFEASDGATPLLGVQPAIAAAALEAISAIAGAAQDQAAVLHRAEQLSAWPSLKACGIRSVIASSIGQPRSILQLRCQPHQVVSQIELPPGVGLFGLTVQPQRGIHPERATESDESARLGHRFILDLARQGIGGRAQPGAFIASISPTDFVEHFRDRIPSKLKGKVMAHRHARVCEGFGELHPTRVYKPRSRVEHHIYENQRAHDFAACIQRARRSPDDTNLVQAGELMYASHWSSSQRYGLGSLETDGIMQMVRAIGPTGGLFGARLAGIGDGALMMILMREGPGPVAALEELAERASKQFDTPVRITSGGHAGAAVVGTRPL